MSAIIIPPKNVDADIFVDFDCISLLATGETITAAAITPYTLQGDDANPAAVVSGAAVITGQRVSQKIVDGVVGTSYVLNCGITTSLGQNLILQAIMSVIDTNPYAP